jgi:glycosyltransferase involved in cell wall biosynthesis
MRLTIYIPTFQRPELRTCLDSILPQLTDDCRLIVSDNDPQQSARPLCQDHRILYIYNHLNVGADANCLRGITSASTEYVWVLGDDDIVLPGAIEATLDMLQGQDRIIHVGERHGEVTFGFDGTTAQWMDSLTDKSMIVASTLCSVNVWRVQALSLYDGIRGLDTRNVLCWAGMHTKTVRVANQPYVAVGCNHPFPFPEFGNSMDRYLLGYRNSAGTSSRFTMREANHWNYTSA